MPKQKWTKKYIRNMAGGWTLTIGTDTTCRINGFGKTKTEALYDVLDRVAELANTKVSGCYLHCRIGRG